jgi:Bacterial SH3 domain
MKRFGRVTAVVGMLLLTVTFSLRAQRAEVTRNVNLRPDPSADNPPIRLLTPSEQLQLLEPDKTAGYYHVKTSSGEQGWVWSRNVNVLEATPTPTPSVATTPTPGTGLTTTPPTTPSGPATAVDPSWEKGTPAEITFKNGNDTCGPDGKGDTETNHLKNRVDEPTAYHEVTFDSIVNLPKAHVKTKRSAWTTADRATAATDVVPFEGVALSVVGFIVNRVKVQSGGTGEGTNCNLTLPAEVDWHIPLVAHAHDPEKLSLVVETTPRVRLNHPKWTVDALNDWVNGDAPVRISGWLMFDPDHPPMMFDPSQPNLPGKFRQTLWEIHPITKIEVSKNNEWVDLESLP